MKLTVCALAAMSMVACGDTLTKACTEIGCVSGLHVTTQASSWPAGTYVFDVDADGAKQRCEGKLPFSSCDQGLTCTGANVALITSSGCALPPSAHSFGDITLATGPARVLIKVTRDGAPIGEANLTPAYQTSRPNGPTCEPVCRQANGTLTLSQ